MKLRIIFLDIRFAGDTKATKIHAFNEISVDGSTREILQDFIYRSKLSLSLGYEFGFGSR
jgi:hypothetical protein